jgi:uncharacterized protein YndB with AHSA1/START domain
MTTNEIRKQVLLRAPRPRVWKALTDAREFGAWFGMKLDGPFAAGRTMRGTIAMTTADPAVAKMQEPYVGRPVELVVERIEPETRFVLEWHPFAIEPDVDYSHEPMTTITFTLDETPEGTLLTVVESGFDAIPIARRAAALRANDGGWAAQMDLIRKYLDQHA